MKKIYTLIVLVFVLFFKNNNAQCLFPVSFTLQSSYPTVTPLTGHDIIPKRDTMASRPYLYVAGNEQGLKIFNITGIASPTLISTVPTASLGNLNVSNITQSGNYLFLALGDIFSATAQKSGMGIVDVTNPNAPVVKSVYSFSLNSGANCITLNGNIAYLSAMQNGIIVLDVTNKSAPVFISQLIPNLNFPKNNPTPGEKLKINTRSAVYRNNVLYVCDDAGGFRVINASNPSNLKETGRYSNPALLNRPRAFNNCVLNDTLVYSAVDYAGMEILNIKDTSNIKQVSWWNPWNAQLSTTDWFKNPGHCNNIEYDDNCKMLYMSAGRTDIIAVSVANPLLPDSCQQFGIKTDSVCSYGMSRYKNQLFVGYASTWPYILVPFAANWSGTKIVALNNNCSTGINEMSLNTALAAYPNPAHDQITIFIGKNDKTELFIYDAIGNCIENKIYFPDNGKINLSLKNYCEGIYFVKVTSGSETYTSKFVVDN
jgi:hypothetical protein